MKSIILNKKKLCYRKGGKTPSFIFHIKKDVNIAYTCKYLPLPVFIFDGNDNEYHSLCIYIDIESILY